MRRSFHTRILLFGLLAGLNPMSGCSPAGSPVSGAPDPSQGQILEVAFTLHVGDEREIPGTSLRLGFLAVPADSRCPPDVSCPWEGDAEVQLAVSTAAGNREVFSLHTNLPPRFAVVLGAHVELVTLTPQPTESEPIPSGSYLAEFRFDASGIPRTP